jgi:hypothetical protein
MSPDKPSRSVRVMTWLAVGLSAVLLVWGIAQYGWSTEVNQRFWSDIFSRASGPMTFRFYLQPTMALIAALHDGIRDARFGHKAFFWTAAGDPTTQHGRLREGVESTARIVLLGLSMDVIYQHKVLHTFYPVEAVLMAILLAVVPYFIFRWIVEGASRWWFARHQAGSQA